MSNNKQIFIRGIPSTVTEKDLSYKFEKYGDILDISLKRGFAFMVKYN
jgi:RNA recognition motif-containing protein